MRSNLAVRVATAAAAVGLFIGVIGAARAADTIQYEVKPDFDAKDAAVTITVPHVTEPAVRFELPVWAPGAYSSSDTSVNVLDFTATDGNGHKLLAVHPDKQMWEVEANGAPEVRFTYHIKSNDLQVVDGKPKRGHLQGPRTYMYVVGRKTWPTQLTLQTPGAMPVATSLDPAGTSGSESGQEFTAPTYDVLADAPIEMGDFDEQDFTVSGTPFRVVLYGNTKNVDRAKLKDYCQRVAQSETSFFHDIPFKRYVFMFRAAGGTRSGAGGLEHLGSTEISLLGPVDDRARFVIAHEFFHAWNVKRIRPFVLGPFDYINPPHTANLWWSEGVTDYYARLLSRRGGLNTDAEAFADLAQTIGDLQNNPAHLSVSADASSRRVWEANNSQGNGLSYYTKGDLVGLCLDMKIREVTRDRHSLDDVMKALYQQCGRGLGPGFGEDDIKKTVNRIAGQDLSAFYDRCARSTEELPLAESLAVAGLKLAPNDKPEMVGETGMTIRPEGGEFRSFRVGTVEAGGPAAQAGLEPGDRLQAINGAATGSREAFMALRNPKPGSTLTITVERGGQAKEMTLTVGSRPRTTYSITLDPAATPEQTRLREAWLTGR